MITVKLKEKFNTRFGITLVIETTEKIDVGEHFIAGGNEYILQGVTMMAGTKPDSPISVVVREAE